MGPNSVNCGRVTMGEEHPSGLASNDMRYPVIGSKRPFRLRYDIDTHLRCRGQKGRWAIYALSFIGNRIGGRGTSLWGQKVEVQLCRGEEFELAQPGGRMICFQGEHPVTAPFDHIIQGLQTTRRLMDK